MTDAQPPIALTQDRQEGILAAAFRAFATYGFRRTAMDDIARAAGLSRTALYVYYRNKEDIFRTLTQRHFEAVATDMAAALAREGMATEQTLIAAFRAKDGAMMDIILSSPHGSELMDAAFATSADLAIAGEALLAKMIADWLRHRRFAHDLGTPDAVAGTLISALKGLKSAATNLVDYHDSQERLARIFARALDG